MLESFENEGLEANLFDAPCGAFNVHNGRIYGRIAAIGLLLGFAGFIPAYIRRLRGDAWFYEAVSSVNFRTATEAAARFGTMWDTMLTLHAVTAMVWTILAFHQIATGTVAVATLQPRVWHRRLGYVTFSFGICVVAEACGLLWHMTVDTSFVAKGITIAMIMCNLVFGVACARSKELLLHKYAMMWACLWMAAPGHTRIFAYLKLLIVGCLVTKPVGLLSFSTILGVLLVLPSVAFAISEHKHVKLLLLNGLVAGGMLQVDAVGLWMEK